MQSYIPTDDQIRAQFVTSLMNYFKIDEDVFLRSHIDELVRPISTTRYSEFLRRLSSRDFSYKTGIEKISLIAHELLDEQRSPLELEAHERTQKLYALMYDLRRTITDVKNSEHSASERFENVKFTSIKRADSSEPLLDALDIDLIKILTKRWIYDYVANDRGLFEARVEHEYLTLLIEQERLSRQPLIATATKKGTQTLMIAIPSSLIDREDLNLLERALLPLVIRHGFVWGDKPKALSASFLAELLRHSPREVVEALDALVVKKILKTTREKTANGVMILYSLESIQPHQTPITALAPSQYTDSNYYLNLPNEMLEELHAYALEVCDREGLRRELFDDFNLYQRSQNRRSFDWFSEFERWIRRELSSNAPALATAAEIEEAKPSSEEFEMAQYFIRRLSSIDPQFQEPFDVMSWASQIKILSDTGGYSLLDVKSGIDWLFSAKGDWFRPNVPDAYHLRKHFKRIISNTRSFRDGETKLPDGINIFDIIGRE